ncbi:MAG TPA: hypothetical protein ENN43_08555 [bacterium]|nr:hypothetical protein [bacterium]
MGNKDSFFDMDDIAGIFGSSEKKPGALPVKEEKPAGEKPSIVIKSGAEQLMSLQEKETKEEEEEKKPAEPASEKAIEPEPKGSDFFSGVFLLFEEIRGALQAELYAMIDIKSTDNMLLRSLEKTAVNYGFLKNANFDDEGRLRQDGSIDFKRVEKNMSAGAFSQNEIKSGLEALFYMRIKAVKDGLGAEKYSHIKNGVMKKMGVAEGGYKAAVFSFVKDGIINSAFKKAEEAQ